MSDKRGVMLRYDDQLDRRNHKHLANVILALFLIGAFAGCNASLGFGEKAIATKLIDSGTTKSISKNTPAFLPPGIDIHQVAERLNQERSSRFLSAFTPDERLMAAAQNHVSYMATNGVYGHEFGPETKFQKRIFAVGFHNSAGENIGVGYRDLDAAIVGWMNSAGHRRNMLKRKYSVFGLAYSRNVSGKNPRYDHFWVLIMGAENTRGQVPQMGASPL